jgi:hypothetical protein
MQTTGRYLRRVILGLLTFVVVVQIMVVQRFYFTRSDTGRPWVVLAAWFGLGAWLRREPQIVEAPGLSAETERLEPFRTPHASNLSSTIVR